MDVLGHDGDAVSVDSAQVGVLEQSHEVSLSCLLESKHCSGLESEVGLVFLSDFTHKSLEWKLSDEELCGFLIFADFSESNSSGTEAVRLLDASSGRSTLASSLGGEVFAGSLEASSFTGGVFGASHCVLLSLFKIIFSFKPLRSSPLEILKLSQICDLIGSFLLVSDFTSKSL